MKDISEFTVRETNTIEETVAAIQRGGVGLALLLDDENRLKTTITDGDVRRAILNKIPLDSKLSTIFESDEKKAQGEPIVAHVETPHEKILEMMQREVIRQVPVLDKEGRVVELALMSEILEGEHALPLTAVIMAGGLGKRLHPLTKETPKPMLLVNDSPIIERIIKQMTRGGIKKIYIATNFKSEMIKKHFGSGERLEAEIDYITEKEPLGTAGGLSLMKAPKDPTLVINGDILTRLDFRAMYDFHCFHKAAMTVGVKIYEYEIPYGVIETQDVYVKKLVEKPIQASIVNAGVYILNPELFKYVPKKKRFDMTDLVDCLLKDQKKVVSFPVQEYWLDVGYPHDYERAQKDSKNGDV